MADKEIIRLLLVEDDEDDYFITSELLAEVPGLQVDCQWASSYEQARAAIAGSEYDVYLFDYRLGEHSGVELLKELRALGRSGPCIFLTGQVGSDTDMEVMKAGGDDYLVKGQIDAPLLARAIRYARERKRSADQVAYLAYHDNLTGLPNRVMFKERLQSAVSNTVLQEKSFAVLFLDIDNFKRVNDNLGHKAGDELLQEVSNRLRACVRTSDTITAMGATEQKAPGGNTIARLGGDEFTILLMDLKDPLVSTLVAQRVIDTISRPFYLSGIELYVTASIGIAIHPRDGRDIDTLLINADAAMYHAKKIGKNNFQVYRQALNSSDAEHLSLVRDLRHALENNQLQLYYQPVVDIRDGGTCSVETLLRWRHPTMGVLGPDTFIPLAEETGLIVDIGDWVLRQATNQFMVWSRDGVRLQRLSVNISCQQITHPKFLVQLLDVLRSSGIPPACLELEVTESVALEHTLESAQVFEEMRLLGVRVAIDDFGSGYSSFNMLKRMPIHTIKIDKSFIQDIAADTQSEAITAAMIAMARSLGVEVVAEGVETPQQLEIVRKYGCYNVQGYIFSTPLSVQQMSDYLRHTPKMWQQAGA